PGGREPVQPRQLSTAGALVHDRLPVGRPGAVRHVRPRRRPRLSHRPECAPTGPAHHQLCDVALRRRQRRIRARANNVAGMYAITVREPGGPDVLQWTEVPDPVPGPGEVVIDVVASAVNRADLLQRQGLYPPPPGASDIIGLECSGRI